MKDETFVYHQDVREKKVTARGAHNRRTHTGKRGSVKFPSDFLSKKELAKMSGECKTYRMNDPMKWAEFKEMPDDLQKTYITAIRDRFHVPACRIAKMLGVSDVTMGGVCKRLGVVFHKGLSKEFDVTSWADWCAGKAQTETAAPPENDEAEQPADRGAVLPCDGRMTFFGTADDALQMVKRVLGDAAVRITVSWEVADE